MGGPTHPSCAISPEVRALDLDARSGIHTGEVEIVGDDIAGLAVHIGSRVAGLAGAGEILVSRTVKDLMAGSGIAFADRGTHVLKGVPDDWQVYAVQWALARPRTRPADTREARTLGI